MKALIVCQAGVGVGLGHLSRSLVIAKMIQVRFCAEVSLLIQSEPLRREDISVFRHRFIPPEQDLARQVEADSPVDLMVFDLHPQRIPNRLEEVIKVLRSAGTKVIAVDGLLKFRPVLDLIFIPSFHFNRSAGLQQERATILYGWDCFLLDVEQKHTAWTPGLRVLTLTGGSDATYLGATWPSLLDAHLATDVTLDWVTGPFAKNPSFPKVPRIKIVEHVAPTSLGTLMQQANYAVTVFGVSFFELLYLGVPTVVFSPYGGKDNAELSVIAESGVALVATDEHAATEELVGLMHNDTLARQLSVQARAKLNVPGIRRLESAIADLMVN